MNRSVAVTPYVPTDSAPRSAEPEKDGAHTAAGLIHRGNRDVAGAGSNPVVGRTLSDREALALTFPLTEAQEIIALEAGCASREDWYRRYASNSLHRRPLVRRGRLHNRRTEASGSRRGEGGLGASVCITSAASWLASANTSRGGRRPQRGQHWSASRVIDWPSRRFLVTTADTELFQKNLGNPFMHAVLPMPVVRVVDGGAYAPVDFWQNPRSAYDHPCACC